MSIREYCEKMSTEQLQAILRQYCDGIQNISVDAVLEICQILAEREEREIDVKAEFLRFCQNFLPESNDL